MSISFSWIHGNALVIESPLHFDLQGTQNGQLVLTPYGWGAEVSVEGAPGVSWMHLPIPTVYGPLGVFERFNLQRMVLLFLCSGADIRSVHLYDGYEKLQEFNDLYLEGNFLAKSSRNTFELAQPHRVERGLSLSFLFAAHSGPTPVRLSVATAGAEFDTSNTLVRSLRDIVLNLFP